MDTNPEPMLIYAARLIAAIEPYRHIRIINGLGTTVGGFVAEFDQWLANVKTEARAEGAQAVRDAMWERLDANCDMDDLFDAARTAAEKIERNYHG